MYIKTHFFLSPNDLGGRGLWWTTINHYFIFFSSILLHSYSFSSAAHAYKMILMLLFRYAVAPHPSVRHWYAFSVAPVVHWTASFNHDNFTTHVYACRAFRVIVCFTMSISDIVEYSKNYFLYRNNIFRFYFRWPRITVGGRGREKTNRFLPRMVAYESKERKCNEPSFRILRDYYDGLTQINNVICELQTKTSDFVFYFWFPLFSYDKHTIWRRALLIMAIGN